MIFARRALQRRLDDLRAVLGDEAATALASRLNRSGKDRLAAMWELVVLHGLSEQGNLAIERPLPSGRRPDIAFANDDIGFVADVTSISDDGLDEQNPYEELSTILEATKKKLGLKIGGMDLRIGSERVTTARGTRTVLKIPERRRIRDFVRDRIEPELRRQMNEGRTVLDVAIVDETTDVHVHIDPAKSPYNSGSYASYDVPTIKDSNPLYNALRAKAGQLRGADGMVGVIVGDADSRSLADRGNTWNEVDARAIADEFLRQNSSINFVLLLSVREERRGVLDIGPPERKPHALLAFSKTAPPQPVLEALFRKMMAELPKPIAMPVNAAYRSRETGYGWGFHGGGQMSRSRIKISAREVLEVLAGRRTVQDMNSWHRWSAQGDAPAPNTMPNPFERRLLEGRLPVSMAVIKGSEDDPDDWIEVEFGDPDPAITPFR
jgi:hypothetical protein